MKGLNAKRYACLGFTLLEVMVAIAILAFSLLYLYEAQSSSMRLAEKSKSLTIATMLAQKQLIDCKYDMLRLGFSVSDYASDGNFAEDGYPEYTWTCEAPRVQMIVPSAASLPSSSSAQGASQGQQNLNALLPLFSMVSNALSDSVRELRTVVRWQDGTDAEEMRVTTFVSDSAALNRAMRQVPTLPGTGSGGDSGTRTSGGGS